VIFQLKKLKSIMVERYTDNKAEEKWISSSDKTGNIIIELLSIPLGEIATNLKVYISLRYLEYFPNWR
jgi:hypothetical protein